MVAICQAPARLLPGFLNLPGTRSVNTVLESHDYLPGCQANRKLFSCVRARACTHTRMHWESSAPSLAAWQKNQLRLCCKAFSRAMQPGSSLADSLADSTIGNLEHKK